MKTIITAYFVPRYEHLLFAFSFLRTLQQLTQNILLGF